MPLLQFIYTTGWVTIAAAAGGTTQFVLGILNDYDFQCNYLTVSVRQAGLLVTTWAGLIQIEDQAAGRTLFSQAIPAVAIGGTGQLPYPINPPRLFKRNAALLITFTNNVATATDVAVAFHGNKILGEGVVG